MKFISKQSLTEYKHDVLLITLSLTANFKTESVVNEICSYQ